LKFLRSPEILAQKGIYTERGAEKRRGIIETSREGKSEGDLI
jgi:hypothetical protein